MIRTTVTGLVRADRAAPLLPAANRARKGTEALQAGLVRNGPDSSNTNIAM